MSKNDYCECKECGYTWDPFVTEHFNFSCCEMCGSINIGGDYWNDYEICIEDIPSFRKELILMIEQVKYQTGKYNKGTSTDIAKRFEDTINFKKAK